MKPRRARADGMTGILDLQAMGSDLERKPRIPAEGETHLTVPLVISSPGNRRGISTWAETRRSETHRKAVYHAWEIARWPREVAPAHVILARVAARPLDYDGLVAGLKYVRDQVARMCGIDDNVYEMWSYEHMPTPEKGAAPSVLITVRWT